ncbi:MAG: GNAT family N-acetyltransferase [Noviherbaspirillum sp.]
MKPILDNIVWHTLSGPHARYTTGTDEARRYAPGFPPMIGFSDIDNPNFHALAPYVQPGEHLYCDGWAGVAPAGWRIESESIMLKMIWESSMRAADEVPEAVLLGPQHAAAALELATMTRPGPFSLRTIELGEYFGVFDGPRLVAMAGGRMCAGGFSEISGVCTHPDFQGRGLARHLVVQLIRRQMQRSESPFLRVMRDNHGAHGLYQRMGFRDYRESVARVVSRY